MALWSDTVGQPPYNLSVSYTPSSSGQGRYEFTNQTVDYAVSDTGYVNSSVGTVPPSFPFAFIPIAAAGVAFMYNIPGLTQTLQLTSYTACLLLTGQIENWDDPALKQNGANSGVTLPNLAVTPVTESDPAGTNFALEEYCIAEQPAVWAQYAKNMAGFPPPSGVTISATTPGSNWEAPGNGFDEQSTSAVASNVADNVGTIGAVQDNYANDSGFTGANPARAVAAVRNASGMYTLPTPVDVTSALAYATQLADGTARLDFNGVGPNVYNPSTYSYLLTPTTGWSPAKGLAMSQFVNYALTLGQEQAPSFGYPSLGLSLERYGIDTVANDVPGAVAPTAAESTAYACGDLTPAEVQAGQTAPTCGGTANPTGLVSLTTSAPNGPFSSGQRVDVKVTPNSVLTPDVGVYIEECSAPGGADPSLPTQCDGRTHQQTPTFADGDGSADYPGYPIYALPDSSNLGETVGGPACDLNNQCVLYVGTDPNDFSEPHVWSSSFYVNPTPGDVGTNPGNGLPEAPFILALPLLAFGAVAMSLWTRRRRRRRV